MFEAYLDAYDTIVVFLSKQFYGGQSSFFYLRNENSELFPLEIKVFTESDQNYNKYTLKVPKEVTIGKAYDIIEEHSLSTALQFALITKTKKFDETFAYDGDDLGVIVTYNITRFALWAPTALGVVVVVRHDETIRSFPLQRTNKGVFRLRIDENLHGAHYHYLVSVNGKVNKTLDPYARASTGNEKENVIVDSQKIDVELHNDKLSVLESPVDATILECNVRDFSSDPSGNIPYPSTFKAMTVPKTKSGTGAPTGFDYICSLGISHIQLMPVFDFATVDEFNRHAFYNWGYDPIQFNVPEGSYCLNPGDPLARIIELKELVAGYHQAGIRINMDVVYNHVYTMERSSFDKTVPYYYFRYTEDGDLSNGSFCGNDIDSPKAMVRKFIIDSIVYWMNDYGIDGFRFDLMGIIDVRTMQEIGEKARAIKPDVMLYGEGWNMPTALDHDDKAAMHNYDKMPDVAFFNDYFRDHVKGNSHEYRVGEKGYLSGDLYLVEAMKSCLLGNSINDYYMKMFRAPTQSINYVECHDNHTCWDKLKECCKEDTKAVRLLKHKLMLAAVILAQGVPFIHHGQEFCRSKHGISNSYRSPDSVNKIDWARKEQYGEVVDYTRDLLKLRRSEPCFRLKTAEDIASCISYEVIGNGILVYTIQTIEKRTNVYFNPSAADHFVGLSPKTAIIFNETGLITPVQSDTITLKPYSLMVSQQVNG